MTAVPKRSNGDSLVVGSRIGPEILTDAPALETADPVRTGASLWTLLPALALIGSFGSLVLDFRSPDAGDHGTLRRRSGDARFSRFFPAGFRGVLAFLAASAAAWWIWPRTDGIDRIFAMLFLGGGAVNLFAGLYRKDRRAGYWAFSLMTVLSLGSLVLATSPA